MTEPCPICAKHRGGGPLVCPEVWSDDQVVVTHRAESDLLGYLFVEPRRHVAGLGELTETEALAIARAVWLAARALRAELDVESVHTFVAGRAAAKVHLHQHVFVRHRGTPAGRGWLDVDWPGAPHGDPAELCERLRAHFTRP
jgi:diadenosine tetraphosphate (Ap4A) HIT family hydrolase